MPLTIYRRGRVYHYRGTVAGRRLRGSTQTENKAVAKRVAARIEADAWECRLDGPEAVLSFAQAAMLYRKAGKPERFLSQVEDYWRDTKIASITRGAVKQAAIQLYPNASGATRNRQVIVPTVAVINHAAEMDLCPKFGVKRFPVESREKVPVDLEWVQAFMAKANPHLGALALFMFLTGARITEALSLRWDDLDLPRAKALIRQTKIMEERRAHLPAPLVAAIANIDGERIGKVFRYSSRSTAKVQWDAAVRRAGLPHRSFHCCRHGFATAMLHAGIDPVTVAKRGGWKSAQHVLKTYGHAMEDETITDRIAGPILTQSSVKLRRNKV